MVFGGPATKVKTTAEERMPRNRGGFVHHVSPFPALAPKPKLAAGGVISVLIPIQGQAVFLRQTFDRGSAVSSVGTADYDASIIRLRTWTH